MTICSLSILGLMTMGNQKCDQEQTKQRVLKKNIVVAGVETSSFINNSSFNFQEVAQNQLSGVFFETDDFYERNVYPQSMERLNTQLSDVNSLDLKVQNKTASVDEKSVLQMKAWFPTLKSGDVDFSPRSSCFVSRPQHFLYGKINSLEAYSGTSIQFGFNQNYVQIPVSAKIKMDKMRLDLSFHAYDPWTKQKTASVNSEVFKKDYSAGFGIDLGIIHIGPEFYRITGMAEVVLNGLRQSVKDLAAKLKAIQRQEWQSRVLLSRDNYIVVVGGAELGLKKGDKLKIENEIHDWMGEPCAEGSVLLGSVAVTQEPWIVEIEDAGNLISKAKVLSPRENETIEVGALTRVSELLQEQPVQTGKTSKRKK